MIERSSTKSDSYLGLLIFPLWLIAIYAMGLLMNEAATIFLWIMCAFFLFVVLDPIAEYLKKRHWPVGLTAGLLVLASVVLTFFILFALGSLISGMLRELEQSKRLFIHAFDSLNTTWNSWNSKIPGFHPADTNFSQQVEKVEVVQGSPLGGELGGTILHGLGSAVTVLTFSLLVPILAFFFLAERDGLGRVLSRAYVDPSRAASAWKNIVKSTRAFFLGNLVLGIITYPLFILIFWLFSVPSAFTVAALATVFNLIPFAGALLSGFLPAVTLYSQTQEVSGALGLYGCCMAIHFAIADFVTPKILGSRLNINATTSTIALVGWGSLWGGLGLILAIPLTSLIKILFEHSSFFWLRWGAELMSGDVDQPIKAFILRKRSKKKES
jgi:predicted PurR-regulated permease PerM